jgi:hypothetical protein
MNLRSGISSKVWGRRNAYARVEKCAVLLLHVELGLEKHYTASRVLHAFGAIDSPRFIRAVGQKLLGRQVGHQLRPKTSR